MTAEALVSPGQGRVPAPVTKFVSIQTETAVRHIATQRVVNTGSLYQ
jgi:hypothetical protein